MQNLSLFEKKYKSLNKAQKEAVDSIEGPVMVIAGPGTGKTTILTLRIANILLKTDTPPESVLALTFTESGVVSMREKLAEIIGPTAYQIKITTFHGFTNELIQNNPDIFPKFVSFNSATEIDQLEIIQKIIQHEDFDEIRPLGDPNKYVPIIKKIISELKRENISPNQYLELVNQEIKNLESNQDNYNKKTGNLKTESKKAVKKLNKSILLAKVFEQYEKNLSLNRMYDYDDMILSVIDIFGKNPDFLLEQQEKFLYILADEHQDANSSQNKILEYLANFHQSPNIFIVGDEKQAIFRFQGASLENFLYFKTKYNDVKIIELTENYRSTQSILDSAFHVIDNNFQTDRKKDNVSLMSHSQNEDSKILITEYFDEESENLSVVNKIDELIKSGQSPEEIAIIYRKNKEAYSIAGFLEKKNIPFYIKTTQNILDQEDVNKIRMFAIGTLDLTNNTNLAKILAFSFLKNNALDLHKIFKLARDKNLLIIDLLQDENLLKEAGVKDVVHCQELAQKLIIFSEKTKNISAIKYFEAILYETDLIKEILDSTSSLERLSAIERLFNELKTKSINQNNYSIEKFLNYLSVIESYNSSLSGTLSPIMSGVNLMTAHSAKGLEFKYVFIPHLTNKIWDKTRNTEYFYFPNKKLEKETIIEEERRLFYVALTRAKASVMLSYSKFNLDGKENSPSQFVYEIKDELKEFNSNLDSEIKNKYSFYLNKPNVSASLHDKEFIQKLFLDKFLSVSALNNYLNCPWKYFYQNLLMLPKDQSDEQKNGDAVHFALKNFYRNFADSQQKPPLEKFLSWYENFLQNTGIEEMEKRRYLERGKRDLEIFYNQTEDKIAHQIFTEYSISDIEINLDNGAKLKIRGNLDRVDFLPNGEIVVTDYKTTEPKSVNEIMGKTANSNGDYYRQLVFYKMLIDEHYKNDWKMNKGQLIFMKVPEDKEDIQSLEFVITQAEVDALKKTIIQFADEIMNLKFWNKKCDDQDCEFCKFGRPN